jgi:hypothetical protein
MKIFGLAVVISAEVPIVTKVSAHPNRVKLSELPIPTPTGRAGADLFSDQPPMGRAAHHGA